uniref:Heat-inducible transcription repressor HrcA n=1 Tax=Eiseniibacteriota bacterium TaxID=2212470 RepID=A0A832I3B9_UNCEI
MSQPALPGAVLRDDPDLTERQRALFGALVELHRRHARPVGSEALHARSGVALSSAGVRAELAELEARGLLERGHASAGRVPSAAGWAYWVRHLMAPAPVSPEVEARIRAVLAHSAHDVESLLQEASRLLSDLTRQIGLARADSLDRETLTRLDVVPLGERRVLLALNLGGALARTLALELESPLAPDELDEVGAVLRERLLGRTLAEVRERLDHDPELVRHSAARLVARALRGQWAQPVRTPLLAAGASHIAGQPEFADGPRLAPVLRAIEGGPPIDRQLAGSLEGQAAARVGLEPDGALSALSLVSVALPGPVPGAVGVLGPLRMDYALAFAVVDAVGQRLGELLDA